MSWLREAGAEPIPGYTLVEPLGTGGFGEVWKCIAPGEIFKAIKFIYGNLNSDDGDNVRAEQEFKALQRVKEVRHPFVLSIERIDTIAGEVAIVMELADKSLHDLLVEYQSAGQPGIPRNDVIRYLLDTAEGLDHLIERHNLQHLDVKPRNLFLIADRVKVADFGLVKHLEKQSTAGGGGGVTPMYAAPETFIGKISKQSDQYSLAIVYIELLTGQRPFHGKNIRQLAVQHMSEPPDLRMLPEADRGILFKALAKEPNKRFPNCTAFIRALAPNAMQTQAVINLDEEADLGQSPVGNLSELLLPKGGHSGEATRLKPVPHAPDEQSKTQALPQVPFPPMPKASDVVRELPKPARPGTSAGLVLPPPPLPKADLSKTNLPPITAGGVLRPTLVIGLGQFGGQALIELRCRLLDRLGDLSMVPCLRYLYVDSDTAALDRATTGSPEIALANTETFGVPLQPVANYRRRMLDHLNEWLPREKIYAIPRSLLPQGSRALGRLAFLDNYLRLVSRLRRELQIASHGDTLRESIEHTGLTLGNLTPRVIVLTSACGSSSGMLVDLGFSLRRLLAQLGSPDAHTAAVVFVGGPSDPSTPKGELANAYATLSELNHFADPSTTFTAQYGPDGPRVTDEGTPFAATYLVKMADRSQEGFKDCVSRVTTYLTQAFTTELGPAVERPRLKPAGTPPTPFRSFGTYSVWYPRGLLLRVAARRACCKLLDIWQSSSPPPNLKHVEQAVTAALSAPGLQWESLAAELNAAAETGTEGTPLDVTERYLDAIEKQSMQPAVIEDAGKWAAQTTEKVREWAGSGTGRELESLWKKSKFYRALTKAAQKVADEWEHQLSDQVMRVLRLPGHRVAAGEVALKRLAGYCDRAIAAQWAAVDQHYAGMKDVRDELQTALNQVLGGGAFRLFGGGGAKSIRHYIEALKEFARQRVQQDLLETGVQFYMALQGMLNDRGRDLAFCRQRLKVLRRAMSAATAGPADDDADAGASPLNLSDPFWESVQGAESVQIILPAGVRDLEQSAGQFVESLKPEHWLRLDHVLQNEVLAPLGDLLNAATSQSDIVRHMGLAMIEQAAHYLSDILPITDVAQVEFSAAKVQGVDLATQFSGYFAGAAPMIGGGSPKQRPFLIVPKTESGASFAKAAIGWLPELEIVRTTGSTEITLCREQPNLSYDEVNELMETARRAYTETVAVPSVSAHSRFDLLDWLPLDAGD